MPAGVAGTAAHAAPGSATRLLCFFCGVVLAACVPQARAGTDTVGVTAGEAFADSCATFVGVTSDSARMVTGDTLAPSVAPGKSAGMAVLLSAVLPGAGQFYNESYWKVPIVIGFGVWLGSQWIDNHNKMKDWRSQYSASITADNPGGNSRYLQLREFYKEQRDTYSWYLFIWYMVTLVDAYVDASLYDFSVGDDLSLRVLPASPAGLRLQLEF